MVDVYVWLDSRTRNHHIYIPYCHYIQRVEIYNRLQYYICYHKLWGEA